MTESGLVERESCEQDRRGWYAVITEKGKETFERATPGHAKAVQTYFFDSLSNQDIRDLNRIMVKIIETQNEKIGNSEVMSLE